MNRETAKPGSVALVIDDEPQMRRLLRVTLEALIFYRDSLVETALQLPETANIRPEANLRLLRRALDIAAEQVPKSSRTPATKARARIRRRVIFMLDPSKIRACLSALSNHRAWLMVACIQSQLFLHSQRQVACPAAEVASFLKRSQGEQT
jgi:hypothetical protein